jgi:hypothetical protein
MWFNNLTLRINSFPVNLIKRRDSNDIAVSLNMLDFRLAFETNPYFETRKTFWRICTFDIEFDCYKLVTDSGFPFLSTTYDFNLEFGSFSSGKDEILRPIIVTKSLISDFLDISSTDLDGRKKAFSECAITFILDSSDSVLYCPKVSVKLKTEKVSEDKMLKLIGTVIPLSFIIILTSNYDSSSNKSQVLFTSLVSICVLLRSFGNVKTIFTSMIFVVSLLLPVLSTYAPIYVSMPISFSVFPILISCLCFSKGFLLPTWTNNEVRIKVSLRTKFNTLLKVKVLKMLNLLDKRASMKGNSWSLLINDGTHFNRISTNTDNEDIYTLPWLM